MKGVKVFLHPEKCDVKEFNLDNRKLLLKHGVVSRHTVKEEQGISCQVKII